MKHLITLMALVSMACAPAAQQVTLTAPEVNNEIQHTPYKITDKEVVCAKALIDKLYGNSEQFGHQYFVFSTPPQHAWVWYQKCVTDQL